MPDFDVEKYITDKIESHNPKLHLINHAQSANGQVFIISKDVDRVNSAILAITPSERQQNDDAALTNLIDTRFKKLTDHLYGLDKKPGA